MNNSRVGVSDIDSAESNTRHAKRLRSAFCLTTFIVGFSLVVSVPTVIVTVNKARSKSMSTLEWTTPSSTNEPLGTKSSTISELPTVEALTKPTTAAQGQVLLPAVVNSDTHWEQNAITIAGGHGRGNDSNKLDGPYSVHVDDDDQSIFVTDRYNHRVVQWKFGQTTGQVVAGGNGQGRELNQLDYPTDAILDKKDKALIICDQGNARVVRWSREDNGDQRVLIDGIVCYGLAIDEDHSLYVSEPIDRVRRWRHGEQVGTIVAGGNKAGNELNQLHDPEYIFVDKHQSVYVADTGNGRVMKWPKNATEGTVVVPRQTSEGNPSRGRRPIVVLADSVGNVYITSEKKHDVKRWLPGALEGSTVVGADVSGRTSDRLSHAHGISFDRYGNLYVADLGNYRIQKFTVRSG